MAVSVDAMKVREQQDFVIGARMKQGGMTWSESGAAGMLQIRNSPANQRFLQDFRPTSGGPREPSCT